MIALDVDLSSLVAGLAGPSCERRSQNRPKTGLRASAIERRCTGHNGMHIAPKAIAVRPRFSLDETLSLGMSRWFRFHVEPRCKPTTQRSYRYCVETLISLVGDLVVDEIDQATVLAALDQVRTVSRPTHWTAWAAMFNWLGRYDLTRGVRRHKSRFRRTAFSAEDLPHWIAALGMATQHQWMRRACIDVLLLLTLTGMRKGEGISLRWQDCDLGSGLVDLPDSKTGPRRVWLGRIGASIIASQPKRTEYVFASRCKSSALPHITPQAVNNGMRKALRRYTAATGYRWPDGICPHALRHTFASHAKAAGVSSENVRQLCGWSSDWMADRYSHLVEGVRTDIDKIQGRLVAGLRMQMAMAAS